MKTIAVVITVENHKTLSNLLDTIASNVMLPTKIVFINNTDAEIIIPQKLPGVKIEIVKPYKPLKPNAAWRLGFKMCSESNLICLMHDDILLAFDFFRKVRQASNEFPMASVYCPTVEKDATKLNRFTYAPVLCEKGTVNDDCCFVLRGEFLRDLPVIPDRLTTYFGAKWIHLWTSTIWRRPWIAMLNALAFHHNADTIDSPELYEQERLIFEELKSEL